MREKPILLPVLAAGTHLQHSKSSKTWHGGRQLSRAKVPSALALLAFAASISAGSGLVVLLMWQPEWTWTGLMDAMGGDVDAAQAWALRKVLLSYTVPLITCTKEHQQAVQLD